MPRPYRHALLSLLPALLAGSILAGCVFGGGKKKATPTAAASTPLAAAAVATIQPGAPPPPPTLAPITTPARPVTPPPGTPPAAAATATVASTPGVRTENGLQIQDVSFTARVAASGGLRIRSAPTAASSNVIASVAEGAIVNVEGKVLNGAEAEQGKGTVWYIVGPNQYIYGAEGYIVPVAGAANPTPAR